MKKSIGEENALMLFWKKGEKEMTSYIWDLDGTLLDSYGVIVESAAR